MNGAGGSKDSSACPFVQDDKVINYYAPHNILHNYFIGQDFVFIFYTNFEDVARLFTVNKLPNTKKLIWYPVEVAIHEPRYSYYLTIVFIVQTIEALIKRVHCPTIRYNLCLYRQTFLSIIIYIEETDLVQNDALDLHPIEFKRFSDYSAD